MIPGFFRHYTSESEKLGGLTINCAAVAVQNSLVKEITQFRAIQIRSISCEGFSRLGERVENDRISAT